MLYKKKVYSYDEKNKNKTKNTSTIALIKTQVLVLLEGLTFANFQNLHLNLCFGCIEAINYSSSQPLPLPPRIKIMSVILLMDFL